jgi:hypothetical protein
MARPTTRSARGAPGRPAVSASPEKAKQILREGTAKGRELSPKQQRFFGWLAGGAKPRPGGRKRR